MEAQTQAPAAPAFVPVYQQPEPPFAPAHEEAARHLRRIHAESGATFPAGCDESERRALYWSRMAYALLGRCVVALDQRDEARAETAKVRAEFSAPGLTLSAEWGDIVFEVEGDFSPEERGDREEPGCPAYFDITGVYLNGTECSQALSKEVLDALEADCLAQCEENGRTARAARRNPELAAEAL
ncbi:hypothetical protein [Caldimonas tepidiphila]|uniref:hypothetical protein n=1 Tax=Caldimonas tepidiphila TaxID=2315841 RepID=UPI000E5B7F15|nr:hypothetical protein [Caldimonas tepidiphila]